MSAISAVMALLFPLFDLLVYLSCAACTVLALVSCLVFLSEGQVDFDSLRGAENYKRTGSFYRFCRVVWRWKNCASFFFGK